MRNIRRHDIWDSRFELGEFYFKVSFKMGIEVVNRIDNVLKGSYEKNT